MENCMKIKWTLIKRIILGCILLILLPLSVMGYRLFTRGNDLIEKQAKAVTLSRVDAYNQYYLDEINGNLVLFLEIWDQDPRLETSSKDDNMVEILRNEWASALKGYPEVLSVYYSTTQGEFVNYPVFDHETTYDPTLRGWFQSAVKAPDQIIWTDPYEDAMTKELVITLSRAQYNSKGEIHGVFAIDVSLHNLSLFMEGAKISENGDLIIVTESGKIIAGPNPEDFNENIYDMPWSKNLSSNPSGAYYYEIDEKPITVNYTTNEISNWKVIGFIPERDYKASTDPFQSLFIRILIIVGLWGIILIGLVIYFSRLWFVNPIDKLKTYMAFAETGDLSMASFSCPGAKDEMRQLFSSFENMIKGQKDLVHKVILTTDSLQKSVDECRIISKLTSENSESHAQAMGDFFEDLNLMNQSTQTSTQHLSVIANNLDEFTDSMQEMGHVSSEVADSTVKTAEATGDVSSAVRDLNKAIEAIHKNVVETTTQSDHVNEAVEKGKAVVLDTKQVLHLTHSHMTQLEEEIQALGKSAETIGNIIDFIEDLVEQTTLLSLNASIEAARAGEHGKGFGVVANAISRLAEKAQNSTKDVNTLVKRIQTEVYRSIAETEKSSQGIQNSVVSMEATDKAFKSIESAIEKAVDGVEKIKENAEYELISSQKIMKATEQVTDLTMEVSAATEEQVAAFYEMVNRTETMNQSTKAISENGENHAQKSADITETGKKLNQMTSDLTVMSENVEKVSEALEGQARELVAMISNFKV